MDWYFAYGSNMNPARMQARGLSVSEVLPGRLPGYGLCFDKRAADRAPGRAYANIRYQRDGVVEGVLYRLQGADEIAKLEVEIVALEMLVLRVLSAEKSGKNSLDIAGLLKIRGSEIQQRYSELMMLAAGPYSLPFIKEAMEAGWQGDHVGAAHCAPLAATFFNMRKTTIYGGSNEVQRNIVAQTVLG